MSQPVSPPRIAIGPRVRRSPYFDATVRYGVQEFTIYNHMFRPLQMSFTSGCVCV
jgi:aminomethyltransferase